MRLTAAATGAVLFSFWSLSVAGCDAESPGTPSTATPSLGRLSEDAKRDCGSGKPDPAGALPLPAGAIGARLCSQEDAFPWRPPLDLLTTGVEGLVDVVNAQQPVDSDMCTLQAGIGFELMLAYPDGRALAIPGDTGGCDDLDVGGNTYGNASTVLEAFIDSVEDQRLSSVPPPGIPRMGLSCGGEHGRALSLIGDPTAMTHAISCWRPNADEPPPFARAVLRTDELRQLLSDVRRNSVPQEKLNPPVCASSHLYYWQDLVGQTEWGDVVAISGTCNEFQVRPGEFWVASPSSQEVLRRLRGRASQP